MIPAFSWFRRCRATRALWRALGDGDASGVARAVAGGANLKTACTVKMRSYEAVPAYTASVSVAEEAIRACPKSLPLLLAHGAPTGPTSAAVPLLWRAVAWGRAELLDGLLGLSDCPPQRCLGPRGRSLWAAAGGGAAIAASERGFLGASGSEPNYAGVFEKLSAWGVDPNAADEMGQTPLELVSRLGDWQLAVQLIGAGATLPPQGGKQMVTWAESSEPLIDEWASGWLQQLVRIRGTLGATIDALVVGHPPTAAPLSAAGPWESLALAVDLGRLPGGVRPRPRRL